MTEIWNISKRFFEQEELPILQKDIPEVIPFLAVGVVGEGSDCFGYDDSLSMDHEYGPGFCIWLPETAMDLFGERILQTFEKLPLVYEGRNVFMTPTRRGLFEIDSFYNSFAQDPDFFRCITNSLITTGRSSNDIWLNISEKGLAAAINGTVFLDNFGLFSCVRKKIIEGFPEDIRIYKLIQHILSAAQISQYNYVRTFQRGDMLTLQMIKSKVAKHYCAITFLLNNRYKPFYKWAYRALKDLPILGLNIYLCLQKMMEAEEGEMTYSYMQEINGYITQELYNQKLIDSRFDYLADCCSNLVMHIKDKNLIREPIPLV